jgi:4'-phosphopantetheinyl transferase
MIEVYALKIDRRIESVKFNSLMHYVDKSRQNAISRFYKWEDAQRSLFSELLIRTLATNKLAINSSAIQFDKNEFGKPFVKNLPGFCFNISHSGQWVVCAIDNEEIGIDIEEICPIDLQIANEFFTNQEIIEMQSKLIEQKLLYFYDLWTLKESYIKAWGKGLSIPLDSFSLKVNSTENIELKTNNGFRDCCFKQYDIDPDYKMAVCSLKSEFPEYVIVKNMDEFIESIK